MGGRRFTERNRRNDMSKYVCSVCGYIYDEEIEKVKFDDLPSSWTCPLCGSPKSFFRKEEETASKEPEESQAVKAEEKNEDMKELSNAELSIVFSNLARGAEKQYKDEEKAIFQELSDFFGAKTEPRLGSLTEAEDQSEKNLKIDFPALKALSSEEKDRGALRALTWSEKVTMIVSSLLERYKTEGTGFLKNAKVFVCEICGFVYIGDKAPEICPVCKVPGFKLHEII